MLLSANSLVAQNCYADFYFDSTNCPSINFFNYSFVADSNDYINTTTWDFGDGNSSTSYNPTNTYTSDGTYTVCLTITTQNGCSSTMCQDVYVYCGNQTNCSASFVADTGSCPNVMFYNNSVADNGQQITSYYWDFGDGNTSTAMNPTNNYLNQGYYVVCLTIATSSGCTDTICESVPVFCSQQSSCSAGFSFDSLSCPTVAFYDYSNPGNSQISSYYWNFGDGNTSTLSNPTNTFASAGWYNVCLTITTTDSCSSSYCQMIYVDCGGSSNDCQASIYYSDSACPQIDFFGVSQSNNQGIFWEWSFGDGDVSYDQNPTHIYNNDGYYYVCLTVTTPDSCVSTVCDTVYINCTNAIEEELIDDLILSPNPANDVISISFSDAQPYDIYIIDLNGNILINISSEAKTEVLDISELSSGMYLVKVKRNDTFKTLRLIKK